MTTTPQDQLAYLGFRLIPPGPLLKPYVRSYWAFQRESPLLTWHEEYMHPRGGYGIVFNFGDSLYLDGQLLTEPVFLDGSNTISRRMGFCGRVELMGISFYVGEAYPFLAVPLAELRNETALLDALDRPALLRLHARLWEARTLPDRIALLEAWLLDRLSLDKPRDVLVPASLAHLRRAGGALPIPQLARQLGISQRQLERLYQCQVGMSPKQYAQLVRVETARLALRQMPPHTTTALAHNLGFYDQSHFIREFRAIIGMTPYHYMKSRRQRRPPL